MNKKGFTLVELLAVIAILAILVIIALPNVLELFKSAKTNAFFDEVQAVYTQAVNKYVLTQFGTSTGNQTFCDACGEGKTLNVQNGTGEFHYCVVVDKDGNVTTIQVTDGEFEFKKTGVSYKKAKDLNQSDVSPFTSAASSSAGCA